jgi:2-haloacid dehalogenase
MATAILFDVIDTMLDPQPIRERLAEVFGDPPPFGEWFARLLHASLVATVTSSYEEFGALAGRALDMVAWRAGHRVTEDERDAILGTIARLPPHPEVPGGLERLRSKGFRLATLTNSTEDVARKQLDHAGLAEFFDPILSVETVRRYKPAPEPYRMASEELGVPTSEIRMVAAHDWDVWGAMQAGCTAAFVARGNRPFTMGKPPEIVGPELTNVTAAILARDEPAR